MSDLSRPTADPGHLQLEVDETHEGTRLDVFLSADPLISSRTFAESLVQEGHVLVDGMARPKGYRLKAGERVSCEIPAPRPMNITPEEVEFGLIYQDDDLAVVSKPAGLVVHPAPGHDEGTLVHGLLARLTGLSGIGGEERPGIVHRIDKETSGLMIVAKNDKAHHALSAQLKNREISREYMALVVGDLEWDEGDINAPIGRDPRDRKRMAVVGGGKESLTHFTVEERLKGFTLLRVKLSTGRTHQIRVHLAHLEHPVVGDTMYGGGRSFGRLKDTAPAAAFNRHFLHAFRLSFAHPITGRPLSFEAELPPELTGLLEAIRGG